MKVQSSKCKVEKYAAGSCGAADGRRRGAGTPGAREPTFRGGNRTVAVYATVTGADGRLVPDLSRDAFSIVDNGKRQALTLFANDVQPITVVMLLDRSGSMKANFSLVQQAAEHFVDVMLPLDKSAHRQLFEPDPGRPTRLHVRP